MPNLTFNQIFGSTARLIDGTPDQSGTAHFAEVWLNDFTNEENGGNIENGLGFDNESAINSSTVDQYAVNLFYAIMLLIMQNQATNKDEDIEQKLYIAEAGVSVINFGNRKGQLERRFTVSLFSSEGYGNKPDVDNV